MPSTATHAYFAVDVLDKIDDKYKSKIDIEYVKTFAQGPDPFYFYNLANPLGNKTVRNTFPRAIHDTKTKQFFMTLINNIIDNKLYKNKQSISFLYGFICHYVMDSTIHPFIIYKTGIYDYKNPETYKYKSLHLDIELYLDCYMIFQREQIPAHEFKLYNFCFNINKFDDKFKKLLDKTTKEVYNFDNFSNIYYKSIKQMKWIFKVFRYDRTGIKRRFYILLDYFLPKKQLYKEQLSYHVNYKRKLHYLNNEKNEWNHPFDQYETYNYSFIELYHIALNKAVSIINRVNEVLYNEKNIKNLDKVFTNISYKTGKDCDDDRNLEYFEY